MMNRELLSGGEGIWLGHIACVLHDQTARGRAVAEWWEKRLGSDEPLENYISLRQPRSMRLSETAAMARPPIHREGEEDAFGAGVHEGGADEMDVVEGSDLCRLTT